MEEKVIDCVSEYVEAGLDCGSVIGCSFDPFGGLIRTEAIARAIKFPKPIVAMMLESVRVCKWLFTVHHLVRTLSEEGEENSILNTD